MFYKHSEYTQATTHHKVSFFKDSFNFLQYILLRIFTTILTPLGYKNNVKIFRSVFSCLGNIPSLRSRALNQLLLAYPDIPQDHLEKIAHASWVNLGNVAADFAWLPYLKKQNDFYEFENLDAFKQLSKDYEKLMFFSGHIATWEIFRLAALKEGKEVGLIYRAFNNRFFDSFSRYLMSYGNVPIFQKGGKGIKNMMSYILKGGSVLILVDQYLGGGVKSHFMGIETKTAPSAVDIALKYKMPLVPVFVHRNGIGKFIISVKPPITSDKDGAEQRLDLINKMNKSLEDHIHQHPEEWFWQHRRWKNK